MRHRLKLLQEWFWAVHRGEKTAELRFDDRGYQVGDILELQEWNPHTGQFVGDPIEVQVSHVLRDFEGLAPGWAMLSFVRL